MSPTATHVATARQMHPDWTIAEITRYLNAHGVKVSRFAVARWVDSEKAERHLRYTRDWNRAKRAGRDSSLRLRAQSPEAQAAFIRRLRSEGEPVSGIVRVCRVVFGGRWTRGRVQRLLRDES